MHGGSVSVVLAALTEVYVDLFGNRADRVTPVSILLFGETFSCKSLNLHEGDVVEHSGKEVITRVLTYNLYWIKGVDPASKVGIFILVSTFSGFLRPSTCEGVLFSLVFCSLNLDIVGGFPKSSKYRIAFNLAPPNP